MRVLHRLADHDEEPQARLHGQAVLVAVARDRDASHELHHEVWPARLRRAGVEHLRDVGGVHQRQRLPLGLEPGDHLPRVHARLDDLKGHPPFDRLLLVGHPHNAESAPPDLLQQLVGADPRAGDLGWGPLQRQFQCLHQGIRRKAFARGRLLKFLRGGDLGLDLRQPLAQGGILGARMLQGGRPLGSRKGEQARNQRFVGAGGGHEKRWTGCWLEEGWRGNKSQVAGDAESHSLATVASCSESFISGKGAAIGITVVADQPGDYLLAIFRADEPSFRFAAMAAAAGLFTSRMSDTWPLTNVMTTVPHSWSLARSRFAWKPVYAQTLGDSSWRTLYLSANDTSPMDEPRSILTPPPDVAVRTPIG